MRIECIGHATRGGINSLKVESRILKCVIKYVTEYILEKRFLKVFNIKLGRPRNE